MQRVLSRQRLTIGAGVTVILAFVAAFWPDATPVDMAEVKVAPMVVTVDEEAKTRVHESYIVSAPVTGRLMRVEVEPGDEVVAEETVIANMSPANPDMLNIRAEEQATAAVKAAEAALQQAQAQEGQAKADLDLADIEVKRTRELFAAETVAQARLDRDERQWRAARAALETAKATVAIRQAELDNARALLMSFSEGQKLSMSTNPHPREIVALRAPISGRILRIMQESETTLQAGTPILEIGDTSNDLEVVAELLSTDAVKVSGGDRVIIEKWGGGEEMNGVVERVEPWGFTKYSALGVEEQRVNAIIKFEDENPENLLGHGYRVEARIVIWEKDDALVAPSSALFRSGETWAVFVVRNGRAKLTKISVLQNNGIEAAIGDELKAGDKIILYPSSELRDNQRVTLRKI